ncbi:MAG TPA: hypothetical protein VKG26_11265 [Bacteroidia bacterium]|nr:hypothetical protein [Bacteroidia bacterium]
MKKDIKTTDHIKDADWKINFLFKEFEKESDRASVILVTALIDEELTTLLKLYLIPTPTSTDEVFDGANAPLSNFSSKINLAYRLGLITGKFARDLHLIRRIRNQFAHNVYGCNFEEGGIKQRVEELTKSVNDLSEYIKDSELTDKAKTNRGLFLVITSLFIFELGSKSKEVNPIEEPILEFFYNEYKPNEM